ncbi:hypothetical protein DY000_02016094 [Brassica cretica]|uniref:Uncharacterized protein n=1 Tax=Brassica cretica TaxID=69181 RepID=A0ABQ7D6H6_BRACR|nr:hypothetical protein DY000_02016094 [Brassica cretica]
MEQYFYSLPQDGTPCMLMFFQASFDDSSSCSLPPLGRATLSVSRCLLTSMLLSASHWPRGLTLSSSAPTFLVVVSSSEVYQGIWPGKAVVRWSEPWIQNLEAGTRNLEAGTRNPEIWLVLLDEYISIFPGSVAGGRAAVFSTLRQGFFAEQLQWNPSSTQRHSIHLAISIFRSSSSDSSCLEALMASRACYVAASWDPEPAGTKDCRGLTCGLGPRPAGTEDCRVWCYPPLERCFQPGEPRICCILQWGLPTYPSGGIKPFVVHVYGGTEPRWACSLMEAHSLMEARSLMEACGLGSTGL